MIYDENGAALTSAFGAEGQSLQVAYDVFGNNVWDAGGGDDPAVPAYYQARLNEVSAISKNAVSGGKIVFGIVTDSHGTRNSNNSQAIVHHLLRNGVPWFIHLGDFPATKWTDEEVNSWLNPMADVMKNFYIAIGNHEYYGDINNSSHTDLSLLTNTLTSKNVIGDKAACYYYFDDTEHKIRFIVINSAGGGNYGNKALSSTQLTWLRNAISELPQDWFYTVLGHSNLDQTYGPDSYQQYTCKSGNAIIGYCQTSSAKCVGTFSGHLHMDRSAEVADTGIWHTALLNDSCRQGSGYGLYTPPSREAGTYSEQSVNVIVADLSSGLVTINRIGAGPDISYNFISLTGGVDYPFDSE